ncbi:MAG: YfhO family protein [Terrisporobacter sp.]|uniref:YfhO family protein n=1 Tax=Terrisporobacter sp. TaxID=1965305 RepID=UPI002FC5AAFA
MNSMTRKKKRIIYLLAFIIPIVIMVSIYAMIKIYPFGDASILTRDLKGQYVSYFSEFRDILLGKSSMLYSFTKEMGGNMLGLSYYYLISPFNFLLLLFPSSMITEAIFFMTVLKIGFCGLTASIFINKLFRPKYASIIFSTAYALTAYNIAYQQNIMWLDGVMLLPLILIGIDKIIHKNKSLFYIVTLFLAIATNFYIGFIICIFSCIYFAYRVILNLHKGHISRKLLKFLGSSIIAGLLSSIITIPVLFSLEGGKATLSLDNLIPKLNFNLFDLVSKLYPGAFKGSDDMLSGLPNVYCSVLVILLAMLYFLNKKIQLKEKICSAVVILIFILSMYISTFNLIWHGFNRPVGFPYRYTFVLCLFLIILAYKSYLNLEGIKNISFIIVNIIIIGVSVFVVKANYENLSMHEVMFAVILAILYSIALVIYKYEIPYKNVLIFICAMLFVVEITYNGKATLESISYENRSNFTDFNKDTGKVIKNIKENNSGFYRTDKTFEFNHNDAMLLDYNSLSHFSSIYKVDLRKLLGKLGLSETKFFEYYGTGSTIPVDSILSVRNIISKYKFNDVYEKGYAYKDMTVYNNPFWLPIGFMVNNNIQNVDVINSDDVTFEIQNEILNSMLAGDKVKYFSKIKTNEITTHNLSKTDGKYAIINKNKKAYIDMHIKARRYEPIYMQIDTTGVKNVEVIQDGEVVKKCDTVGKVSVLNLGRYKNNDDLVVRVNFNKVDGYWLMNRIYGLNLRKFNELYNNLSQNEYNVLEYSDTNILGEVTSTKDKSMMYTSIPYDKGWTVTVDGKEATKVKLLNALTGIEIPKGTHVVQFKYIPQGLKIGAIISGVSLLLLIVLCIINKRKNKDKITL